MNQRRDTFEGYKYPKRAVNSPCEPLNTTSVTKKHVFRWSLGFKVTKYFRDGTSTEKYETICCGNERWYYIVCSLGNGVANKKWNSSKDHVLSL